MERTTPDSRWAGRLVIVTGLLLVALGAALFGYSLDAHALYRLAGGAADAVTAHRPSFLTMQWVESRVWVVRLAGIALAVGGAALLARRGTAEPVVARGLGALAASFARLRRDLPARVRAELRDASRLELGVLAAIVVGGVAMRLVFLDDPMRYDETYTWQEFVSKPLAVGLSLYPDQNNHILNTVLAHFSTQLFGHEPWAIRLPAFLAGCLVVPAAYVTGRVLFADRAAALVGAAFVAASSPLIEYSANARGYSFAVLAFLILLALGRPLARRGDPLLWPLFAVVAALGMWAVPTMAYALATVAIWLAAATLLARRGEGVRALRGLVLALVGAVVLTLVLWSPVLAIGAPGLSNNQDYASSLGTVVSDVWSHWTRDMPAAIAVLLVAGLVVSLACHRRVANTRLPPIAAAVPVVLLAWAGGRLVQYPRAWLFLLPLFLLTAGAGVALALRASTAWAARHGGAVPVPIAVLALGVWMAVSGLTDPAIRSQNEGQDAPAMTAWLGGQLRAHGGHVVSVTPFNYILKYFYFPEHGLTGDYVVSELDPAAAAAHVYVVVPGGKTIGQLTGDEAFKPGEGLGFQPIFGLKDALHGGARLVRTYPTARIYTGG
jgi:hypothetical protein